MQNLSQKSTKVAVTGANGFLGSHIVDKFLQKGYQVVGTVRDPSDTKKVAHLKNLPNADKNLTLVKASLGDKNNNFIDAFKGCVGVVHSAAIFGFTEDELINQNVNGTQMVLDAVKSNASTVKNLVFTSATASAITQPMSADRVFDKNGWVDIEGAKSQQQFYPASKAIIEKMVIDFGKQNPSIATSSVNASVIQGPPLSSAFSFSQQFFILDPIKKAQIPGQKLIMGLYQVVDVRDIAELHLICFEKNVKNGRFLACGDYYTPKQYIYTLLKVCKDCKVQTDLKPLEKDNEITDNMFGFKYDTKDTEELLGRPFTKLEDCLRDNVQALQQFGMI